MIAVQVWSFAALLLVALGAWRTAVAADPVRQLLGLNVMAAGASLLLVSAAQAGGPVSPVAGRTMATVGILVAFAVTAFGARLARRLRTPESAGGEVRSGRDACPLSDGATE